jgi:hypothetical protein
MQRTAVQQTQTSVSHAFLATFCRFLGIFSLDTAVREADSASPPNRVSSREPFYPRTLCKQIKQGAPHLASEMRVPAGAPSIASLSHAMGGMNIARTKSSCRCLFSSAPTHPRRHPDRSEAKRRDPRIFFPQKPQQIGVSSPSTPKKPHNPHPTNHIPQKNSWHTSYAPLDTLNIWIKSIEGQL